MEIKNIVFTALKNNNIELVSEIIELIFNISANSNSEDKTTPLHLACCNGSTKVVIALIENNYDLNAIDKHENTPLHIATKNNHTEIAMILIEKGADLNARNRYGGYTPIHLALENDNAENLVIFMIEKGANIHLYYICYAIEKKIYKLAIMMINKYYTQLEKDANTFHDYVDDRPLHIAIENDNNEISMILINKALDKRFNESVGINIKNKDGSTPLHIAVEKCNIKLTNALIENGANLNSQNEYSKCTPIHIAIENGYTELVKLLIKKGADLNIANDDGWMTLEIAMNKGYTELVNIIEKAGGLK